MTHTFNPRFPIPLRRNAMGGAHVARRSLLSCAALAFAAMSLAPLQTQAQTQNWPTAPVKLVLPFAPGSSDALFRLIAPHLSKKWGQPVVIEYKPGASNIIATEYVIRAKPDGHTIGVTGATVANNPLFYKKIPYTYEDFSGVTRLVGMEMALVARNDAPFNNLSELMAYAKANPGKLSWGTGGLGATYAGVKQLLHAGGVDLLHVNFPGTAPALNELMAERIDLVANPFESSLEFVRAGKMKMIASLGPKRIKGFESYMSISEMFPGVSIVPYYAFIVPKETPRAIVNKIQADTTAVLRQPDVNARLATLGFFVMGATPEETDSAFRQETVEWRKIAADIKLPPPQ